MVGCSIVLLIVAAGIVIYFKARPEVGEPTQLKVGNLLFTPPAGWTMEKVSGNILRFYQTPGKLWPVIEVCARESPPQDLSEGVVWSMREFFITPYWDNFFVGSTEVHGLSADTATYDLVNEAEERLGGGELVLLYYEGYGHLFLYEAAPHVYDIYRENFTQIIESIQLIGI